jgi:uncharacterized protein YdaU (DUF1376 family)
VTKEAKPDAWMPLYIGDWEGDTGHLDCEQDGAYGRLIRWYWRNGPLPDDDLALSRIIRMPLARWRKVRRTIAAFFQISDGVWRHKRQDEERERWTEKRRKYIERASAGGRAKAAKRTATSTTKALLNGCTSSSSTEVDGSASQSTLCGQNDFLGPKEVRDAFTAKLGDDWARSYLDPCGWQDVPERALIPATRTGATKLIREGRAVLAALGLSVLEKAA